MSKLTKPQAKAHQQACELLEKDVLTFEDKLFVLEHWQESAKHINTIAGAFFTPVGLARDFSIEVFGPRVIDLCAGIGSLAFMSAEHLFHQGYSLTCVEKNPEYVSVGRKILPQARWVEGSVFELPADIGHFDCAIGNPPFGATARDAAKSPRFTGKDFEYHVIDVASDVADYGVFIVPQQSAPFEYSGKPNYRSRTSDRYSAFNKQTGIELGASCGIDTDGYRADWHGVSVVTEIVTADFVEARQRRAPAQASIFEAAA